MGSGAGDTGSLSLSLQRIARDPGVCPPVRSDLVLSIPMPSTAPQNLSR